MIVEWPSADRLDLEAQARKGILVVRYEGCEMEVLRACQVTGAYRYAATTRQDDRVHIRDEDALYANIPVYAAKFEGALKSAGELTVAMSMVGRYEATRTGLRRSDLVGECSRATHVITSLTAGAFEFYSGAEQGKSAGVDVLGVGAGAKTSSVHTTLNRAGKPEACDKASVRDSEPPDGCGALLRVEVAALEPAAPVALSVPPTVGGTASTPACALGSAWDGTRCAPVRGDQFCAPGMEWSGNGCGIPWRAGGSGDGCPQGTSFDSKTKNCTVGGGASCPQGTRFEEGRGCMAGPALPQSAPSPAPRCPAGMAGVSGGAFRGSTSVMMVLPFCMDTTEVTVDAYKACVEARKCTADNLGCDGEYARWANYGVAYRGNHPVNCVSWTQAVQYCAAQGKRLPAAHEWEWAARSGLEARKYPWGDSAPSSSNLCFGSKPTPPGTCAVGSFRGDTSVYAIHDLGGNVSEWISNVSGGWQYARGGAWNGRDSDFEVEHETSHWTGNKPDRYPYIGFRCVQTAGR